MRPDDTTLHLTADDHSRTRMVGMVLLGLAVGAGIGIGYVLGFVSAVVR